MEFLPSRPNKYIDNSSLSLMNYFIMSGCMELGRCVLKARNGEDHSPYVRESGALFSLMRAKTTANSLTGKGRPHMTSQNIATSMINWERSKLLYILQRPMLY